MKEIENLSDDQVITAVAIVEQERAQGKHGAYGASYQAIAGTLERLGRKTAAEKVRSIQASLSEPVVSAVQVKL